jgi:condensin complex subunit 1
MIATDTAVPKPQRQGAIIILGMLAVAKREVVTEQVENLLKIGLGPHGMVGLSTWAVLILERPSPRSVHMYRITASRR